ncbi:glycosyltransferase [Sporolactobacillus kofuensis]|uniref:Glycosyltransferase n=1 Tax=Sporolactobacillus kofuensis TaxID=269672 RepID=A0ABW1WE35_9BACL|nr:glycosyltransferase [Sporolactobacillus kofuensis]MCO7174934.1 glycosyltransferase [Sporolactobacillus kofuensis]
MNILFVVGEFPKLSQTFILNQITGMIDAGHDVMILAKKSGEGHKVHPDVLRYELLNRVIYYGDSATETRLQKGLSFAKALGSHLIARCLKRRYKGAVPLRILLRHPNLILLIRKLNQVDLSERTIIMAHFGPNGILAQKCIEVGLLRGQLFTAFHGYDMLRYVKQKGAGAYRDLFHSTAVILPISNYWRRRCLELGADPSRTVVHHMGIDLLRFDRHPSEPRKPITVVSAARLVEKKGLDYAIEAIGLLVKKGYSLQYFIAGDGPLKDELQTLIERKKLNRYVQLLGWQTQDEWIARMKNAQIVLAPSITASDGDMEGIPVQLMEAMAMCKVVVSTEHSGIPELIKSKQNGYLVAEKDTTALAETLAQIIQSPESWRMITQNAHEMIHEQFNIHKLNKQLIQLFDEKRIP